MAAFQGPDFLIFLYQEIDGGKLFLYVDGMGNVMQSTSPKPVKIAPDGMREVLVLSDRNKKYWGIDRTFTVPLKWVLDGGKIIKDLFYRVGPEAKCNLLILEQEMRFTDTTYDFVYGTLYEGEPDLTTFQHEGPMITAATIEGGLVKYFKANENTVYEIPIALPNAVSVLTDGVPLQETGNFSILSGVDIQRKNVNTSGIVYVNNIYMPMLYVSSEGQSTGVTFLSQQQMPTPSAFLDRLVTDNWFIQNSFASSGPVTFHYKAALAFKCISNDSGAGFRMRFLRSGMTLSQQDTLKLHDNTFALTAGSTYILNVDMQITLQPDERLYLEGVFVGGVGGSSNTVIQFLDTGYGTMQFSNRYPATQTLACTLMYVFQSLVSKLTNGKYKAASTVLSANDKILLSSGDAIRRIATAVIKTSISEFFNGVNCIPGIGPIGMGVVGGELRIEPLSYWMTGMIIDLGEVNNFKSTMANDYWYNTVKVGYAEQSYDNVNGRDEFNNTLSFVGPNLRSPKEYNIVSPWRADCFGIENARANLDGKGTTDSSSDNDKFLLATDGAGHLDRTLNAGATGVIYPEGVFNIPLSPKRIMISHAGVLAAISSPGWFKYQTTEKNSYLVAGGVTEREDVSTASLQPALFIAQFFDFECPVPDGYKDLVLQNPIRRYKGITEGVEFIGLAMKTGVVPGGERSQAFTLLASPDMDMTKLREVGE